MLIKGVKIMTLEVADRLQKLRKEKGYSQEELADALGISRQAVSKWERAESSPDTDNLILLARLYGMSLDDILTTSETEEEIKNSRPETGKKESVIITDDEGQTVRIEDGKVKFENPDGTEAHFKDYHGIKKSVKTAIEGIVVLSTIIGFIVWGTCFNGWKISWTLFVLMPALISIGEVVSKKRISAFVYPCLIAAVYCFIGMKFGMWHPWWVLFLTIPVFYFIAQLLDKIIFKATDDEDDDKKED